MYFLTFVPLFFNVSFNILFNEYMRFDHDHTII